MKPIAPSPSFFPAFALRPRSDPAPSRISTGSPLRRQSPSERSSGGFLRCRRPTKRARRINCSLRSRTSPARRATACSPNGCAIAGGVRPRGGRRSSSTRCCCPTRPTLRSRCRRGMARLLEGRRDRRRSVFRPRRRRRLSRLLGVGRRDGAGRLREQRQSRPTTTGWRRTASTCKGKIALVRYSMPYSYRGFKALTAEQRGAAGHPHLLRPGRGWIQERQDLPGRTVGARKPHPARRHRLRLPRAWRSADAGMGLGAGREADRRRGRDLAAEDHERAAVVARCARRFSRRSRRRRAGGVAGRPADHLSRRRRIRARPHARARWTTGCARSGQSPAG